MTGILGGDMLRAFPVFCENGYYVAWVVEDKGKTTHHIAKTMVYRDNEEECLADAERLIERIKVDREQIERIQRDAEQKRGLNYEPR